MPCFRRVAGVCLSSVLLLSGSLCVSSCGKPVVAASAGASAPTPNPSEGNLSWATGADPLLSYTLNGDTEPVHDPSVIRQGSIYYAFSSDVNGQTPGIFLNIRCSQDKVSWSACGSVFPNGRPAWLAAKVAGLGALWAPDISYFNGLYHVYYAGSTSGSQQSVIGLATNTTLDFSDPAYKWVDQGEVLESQPGDDYNAIDPNILIDTDGSVWMTYGSYWTGIKQRQVDPATGKLLAGNTTRYDLATRPGVSGDPIEGASLIHHGGYYYLFVSVDYCCNQNVATDNYKEAVGRSTSPHGPFVDEKGTAMTNGGGTVILQGDATWSGPGGGTAYIDASTGESLIAFHALRLSESGTAHLWVKSLAWDNDWPSIPQ